eukprot:TRINITY_DN10915_c0_g1_i4.p1 TRINITY_DN10915_c0_g1~~TRINITY_DN10915_c0_g1_i4.p1  ORF type:complete len:446 (+),score=98.01 TRINITY_DN10915_c0_g1_i4:1213-2550(+)
MINRDYEEYRTNKIFRKEVSKISETKNTQPHDIPTSQTFQGSRSFPEDFVSDLKTYANMEIEVEEYARAYMQHLRVVYKYSESDFYDSLRPSTNEAKLRAAFDKTSGKGGYPLFSTSNKKFIIKQISENEKNVLLNVFLVPYCQHVLRNSSFICRILGLFGIQIKYFASLTASGKKKIHKVIMQNIDPLPSELVDFKYDLKMSTVKRELLTQEEVEIVKQYFITKDPAYKELFHVSEPGDETDAEMDKQVAERLVKLKDEDFSRLHRSLPIGETYAAVWESAQGKITRDVLFLKGLGIMDYSLIITVARVSDIVPAKDSPREERKISCDVTSLVQNENCMLSPSGKFLYVFGIIDVLQEYDIEKKGEKGMKTLMAVFSKKSDISCQPPDEYAARFLEKLGEKFKSSQECTNSEKYVGGEERNAESRMSFSPKRSSPSYRFNYLLH